VVDLAGADLAEDVGISEVTTGDLVVAVEGLEMDTTRDREVHHEVEADSG